MYGDRPEPVEAARSFVSKHLPSALSAFLGGSVMTAHRTPTSDLDVVVLLDGPPAPYRETFEHERWVVEAFVHTRASLEDFWERDRERRVCSLLRMCAESIVLTDPAGAATDIQQRAAALLAGGPGPLTEPEVDAWRYRLTDLLDDMAGCDDEAELAFIAGAVLREVASIALATSGRWGGNGKALARQLAAHEPELVERLLNGHRHVVVYGDTAVLHRAAVEVLLRIGGPLLAGYRAEPTPRVR